MSPRTRLRKSRRGGAVIIAALVCLLIVVAMIGAMLTGTLRARRQLRVQRDLRQCELLLTAGVERAAHRLAKEADYRGESWSVAADGAIGLAEGHVSIAVSRPADDQPRRAHVVAEYPLGSEQSIRRSVTVSFPSKSIQP